MNQSRSDIGLFAAFATWLRVLMGVGAGVYSGIETTRGLSAITPYTAMTFAALGGSGHEAGQVGSRRGRAGTKFHQWPAAGEDQIWQ
jgi:hypothetical protein